MDFTFFFAFILEIKNSALALASKTTATAERLTFMTGFQGRICKRDFGAKIQSFRVRSHFFRVNKSDESRNINIYRRRSMNEWMCSMCVFERHVLCVSVLISAPDLYATLLQQAIISGRLAASV